LLEGAKERDIIYAGLEEVMSSATTEVINTAREKKLDLRMAAYVNGIRKIHEFYTLAGIAGCEWSFLETILSKLIFIVNKL